MPHSLEAQLGAVGRQARRLILLYTAARTLTVVVAAAVALAVLDWLVHFRDPGLRFLSLAALLTAWCWAAWRFLLPAARARLSDADLALRLERRLPIDADRLASAVGFLGEREDDPLAGSAGLRRAVIAQAAAEVDRLKLETALDRRPAYRAAIVAGLACGGALVLIALAPSTSRIALSRLLVPWSSVEWPKQNHLVFVDPVRRLAAGQTFEVELRDSQGASLPDDVQIHYRFPAESGPSDVVERMHAIDRSMIARKENVTRPFAYRAVGGDDDSMPWIELEVVEPPGVEKLAVTLHYPAYTGWPSKTSDPHLRALTGTRVEFAGQATAPLRRVAARTEEGEEIVGAVAEDGRSFKLPAADGHEFIVQRSGAYWLELTDHDGFSSGERWRYEIRAVEDMAPAVVVEEPAANLFVTAEASVPVRIVTKDDLAIHQVALRFTRSDKSADPEAEIIVYQGPAQVGEATARLGPAQVGESRSIEHRLELKPLRLAAGAELTLYATATDYHPHLGQSQPRRLTIITLDELQERLAERQNYLINELSRILKLERDARAQVSGVEIQLRQVGQLNKQDVDHLQAAELIQRQVERGLTSPTEGVAEQIASLLDDLTNNKADSPGVERQMRSLLDEIQRLGRDELPQIAHDLTAGLKAAQSQAGGALAPLASAGGHQDEVIETLERLTAELAQWDDYRRFHREIAALRREQEELSSEAAAVGRKTLTKDLKDLEAQQQADLKKLASRQLELARRFDKIQQRMQRTIDDQAGNDPLAAGAIADALSQARDRAITSVMRQSGRQVEANQMGQAAQSQRRLADDLQEMLDILANRREHELGRLVKKLREAESELAGLRERQEGLLKKWQAAAEQTDEAQRRRELERLAREQRQLGEQTQRLARRLARLQAEQAGRSTASSGGKMGRAGEQGQQGDGQAAGEQAAQAEQDLEQAQRELAQRRAEAETDLAHEQLARLEDGLRGLHQRQARLLEDTQHYADLLQSRGEWTRAETTGVGDLGRHQHELADETQDAGKKLDAAPVFRLALDDAARSMARAAAALDERRTDDDVRNAQRRALDLLLHTLDALKPPAADGNQDQAGGDAGDAGQPPSGNPPPSGGIHALAELKLLKWMQDDVNQRTKALEKSRPAGGELSDDQRREYGELSEQQGKIADLLLELAGGDANDETEE